MTKMVCGEWTKPTVVRRQILIEQPASSGGAALKPGSGRSSHDGRRPYAGERTTLMKLSLGTQMGSPVNGGMCTYAKGVATSLPLDLMLADAWILDRHHYPCKVQACSQYTGQMNKFLGCRPGVVTIC